METSNYDITKNNARLDFLKYDMDAIQKKFQMESDDAYLYLNFAGQKHRISRRDGVVEWSDNGFGEVFTADYYDTLSVYDILCYSKEGCHLAGEFCPVNSLPGVAYCATPGKGLFDKESQYFDRRTALLAAACEKLGGKKQGKGDVSYCLPLFDFLPVIVQFWESDEEFEASFQILWDKNTLDYMHYETTYYAVNHLVKRLKEEMEEIGSVKEEHE